MSDKYGPDLRPCPFCGGDPIISKSPLGYIEYIECLNCDLKTTLTPDEWNIRTGDTVGARYDWVVRP